MQRKQNAAEHAYSRNTDKTRRGDEILPFASRFGGRNLCRIGDDAHVHAHDAETGQGARGGEQPESVGQAAGDGRAGKDEYAKLKSVPAPQHVRENAARNAPCHHADEIPGGYDACVPHIQTHALHDGGQNIAEIPVVELFEKVGEHNHNVDQAVARRDGKPVKIVVDDSAHACAPWGERCSGG